MHHAITVLVLLATAGLGIHSSLQIERTTQPAHTDVEPVTAIAVTDTANPLLETWDTPFGVPPFDRIGDEDYLPAFRVAMEEHRAEIAAIVGTPVEPSFANTIEAFERSGAALGRVANVFFAVEGAHGNDALREVARTVAPELAAHRDDVMLNRALYLRVKAVFDARDELDLTPEQDRLLEETHKAFVRRGVGLETEPQNRLRAINAELV
jgi:peptidyl-dipeptidase Dcp